MIKYQLLIDKFLRKEISLEERNTLKNWVSLSDENHTFFQKAIKEHYANEIQEFDSEMAYQKFMDAIMSKKNTRFTIGATFLKYAALLVLLLSIGFLTKDKWINSAVSPSIEVVDTGNTSPNQEITIKMADGTIRTINTTGNEAILDEHGKLIANKNSSTLSFQNSTEELANEKEIYNEVYIPFGQKFELELSDGTLVWLNAGSKLRFPQKFIGTTENRMVYLEGEAFFDVTTNKEKPFIVNTQELDIKVHGTKFNVSSYADDKNIATTLVEGSVSVYEARTPENSILLTPSYQATYDKYGNNLSKKVVDTKDFTAWIDNRLVINNLNFLEILTKLERRYQVKFINNNPHLSTVIYKGEFEDESIESILETIALSTPFTFKRDQNIITITN